MRRNTGLHVIERGEGLRREIDEMRRRFLSPLTHPITRHPLPAKLE